MGTNTNHKWTFKARFRRHAFGWRSQPAIQRIREAVSEIKKVARKDKLLAAEGAVAFLERLSPAIEQVDGSSGGVGSAVNRAIDQLVPIMAGAPADDSTRRHWLERLFEALQDDDIPYLESLGDSWGELCATPEIASAQADELIGLTRRVLGPERTPGDYFKGSSVCLSALYRAGRFAEIIELTAGDRLIWPYKEWAVKSLAAQGQKEEAIRLAESCRSPWASDLSIDRVCEEILLSSGQVEDAYQRYGLSANRAGTYLATFRAVVKRYPDKEAGVILADLVQTTPGEEGKWFAAAKTFGLYDEALALARRTPCDPQTLSRAARDFADKQPRFAVDAGLLALYWLVEGYGYDITGLDVRSAYEETMKAATRAGIQDQIQEQIRAMVVTENTSDRFVTKVLGRQLGIR